MYRVLLVLLLALLSTGCSAFRDDTPLLWRSRRAKNQADQELEYQLFEEVDSNVSRAIEERSRKAAERREQHDERRRNRLALDVDRGSAQGDSNESDATSRYADHHGNDRPVDPVREEELAQTKRIINLIERTDDDLLRRILAEKLPGKPTAEETQLAVHAEVNDAENGLTLDTDSIAAKSFSSNSGASAEDYDDVNLVVFDDVNLKQHASADRKVSGEKEPGRLSYSFDSSQDSASADARFLPAKKTSARLRQVPSGTELPNREFLRTAASFSAKPAAAASAASKSASPKQGRSRQESPAPKGTESQEKSVVASLADGRNEPESFKVPPSTKTVPMSADWSPAASSSATAARNFVSPASAGEYEPYRISPDGTFAGENFSAANEAQGSNMRAAAKRKVVKHEPTTELLVKHVTFCKAVTGFGQYEPFASDAYPVGQDILIYCELENFISVPVERDGEKFHESLIKGGFTILNSERRIVHHHSYSNVRDLARRKRRDFYMYFPATIPNLPAGEYFLKLDVEDLKGKKFGSNTELLKFTIR